MLVTEAVSVIGAQTDSSAFTEVTGPGYTAGGEALVNSWTRAAGVSTYDSTANASWSKTSGGPANIKTAVVYDTDAGNTEDVVCYVDMTTDGGVTPISLDAGNISITWNANGLFTLSV